MFDNISACQCPDFTTGCVGLIDIIIYLYIKSIVGLHWLTSAVFGGRITIATGNLIEETSSFCFWQAVLKQFKPNVEYLIQCTKICMSYKLPQKSENDSHLVHVS